MMIKKDRNSLKWFKLGFGLLLNLVLVLNLSLNCFHDLEFHNHSEEQICNDEFEKDACHRYLVHHEESASCNKTHKHLASKTEDCFVCKYFKERTNELCEPNKVLSLFISAFNVQFSFSEPNLKSNFLHLSFVRGPPVYTL